MVVKENGCEMTLLVKSTVARKEVDLDEVEVLEFEV